MAQSQMDGGSGGWRSFLGDVVELGGATLADKITNATSTSSNAERTADQTLTEDIQGTPTPTQTAQVGGINVDARTLLIGGGVLVSAVALYLIASK